MRNNVPYQSDTLTLVLKWYGWHYASSITSFGGYILLPLLCSMTLISPNFAVSRSFFPNFGQGPFPKIAGKSPTCRSKFVYIVYIFH